MILHHVGLSGGKDSTALWGWILNDSGIDPATVRGSFSDTQNEHPEVYEQIAKLSEYGQQKGAPPIKTLDTIGFLNLCIKKKRFPGAKSRFCTEHLKIIPSVTYVALLKREGYPYGPLNKGDGNTVTGYTGVRADESQERSKLPEEDFSTLYSITVKRPLLDWTLHEVWQAHKKYSLPINPLYFQGRTRVGCRLCIMSNKRDVRVVSERNPEVIDEIEQWETKVTESRNGGVASFFPTGTATNFASQTYHSEKKNKTFPVNTIRDVVAWSKTARGGVQPLLPVIHEMDDAAQLLAMQETMLDDSGICRLAMGACE